MNIPKIKFSYNLSRGSCYLRKVKAQKTNEHLFSGIMNLFENTDSVSIRNIEKTCKQIMPEPIHFTIKKMTPNDKDPVAGSMLAEFLNLKLVKYRIQIESGTKLDIKQLPILIHELTHLLDMLFNPKTISAEEKLLKMELTDIFEELYEKYYWIQSDSSIDLKTQLKNIKKYTEEKLRYLCLDDKIVLLNNIKQNLITEINALKEEEKYAKELKFMGRNVDESSLSTNSEYNIYESELKLIKKILYKVLKNERYKLSLERTSNPFNRLKIMSIHELKNIFNA